MKPLHAMVGGAQKAGTSSLANYLSQHPALCLQTDRELTCFVNDAQWSRGYDVIAAEQYAHAQPGQHLIAKSAGILDLPEALARLKTHNPDIKLIFMLRNPVDRAYSAFWFARQMGWEPHDNFEDALRADPARFAGDWVRARNTAYLSRGLYAQHLREVYNLFPRKQVRIALVEDMKQDAAGVCRSLFEFLEVDASFTPDVTHRKNAAAAAKSPALARAMASGSPVKRALHAVLPGGLARQIKQKMRHWNSKPMQQPPMAAATREMLMDYYVSPNEALGELVGRDLSYWST